MPDKAHQVTVLLRMRQTLNRRNLEKVRKGTRSRRRRPIIKRENKLRLDTKSENQVRENDSGFRILLAVCHEVVQSGVQRVTLVVGIRAETTPYLADGMRADGVLGDDAELAAAAAHGLG